MVGVELGLEMFLNHKLLEQLSIYYYRSDSKHSTSSQLPEMENKETM